MMVNLKGPPAVKDPKKFVTELCLPVSPKAKVDKQSGYALKPIKPMKALAMYGVGDVTTHSGEIIDKLMKELKDKKKKPAGPVCQICFSDPKEFPPEQQVFQIVQPIK